MMRQRQRKSGSARSRSKTPRSKISSGAIALSKMSSVQSKSHPSCQVRLLMSSIYDQWLKAICVRIAATTVSFVQTALPPDVLMYTRSAQVMNKSLRMSRPHLRPVMDPTLTCTALCAHVKRAPFCVSQTSTLNLPTRGTCMSMILIAIFGGSMAQMAFWRGM